MLFFLRTDVEEALIKLLTSDVLRGDAGTLQLQNLDGADRLAVREFLLNERPRDGTLQRIRHLCPDRPSVKQTIYLLRGVLVNRILMMTEEEIERSVWAPSLPRPHRSALPRQRRPE